jgi:hypothetical protein
MKLIFSHNLMILNNFSIDFKQFNGYFFVNKKLK